MAWIAVGQLVSAYNLLLSVYSREAYGASYPYWKPADVQVKIPLVEDVPKNFTRDDLVLKDPFEGTAYEGTGTAGWFVEETPPDSYKDGCGPADDLTVNPTWFYTCFLQGWEVTPPGGWNALEVDCAVASFELTNAIRTDERRWTVLGELQESTIPGYQTHVKVSAFWALADATIPALVTIRPAGIGLEITLVDVVVNGVHYERGTADLTEIIQWVCANPGYTGEKLILIPAFGDLAAGTNYLASAKEHIAMATGYWNGSYVATFDFRWDYSLFAGNRIFGVHIRPDWEQVKAIAETITRYTDDWKKNPDAVIPGG
ncbi:MAG: hypothetical protein NTW86_15245 [Candidatus Sumerlaeota bacterium]|nr:hypothetical protein [Candidatus Sumerlaeota bacterium]